MEKDFAWLCSLLIASGVRMPVPETAFFWKEELILWVISNVSGELKRVAYSEDALSKPADVLRHFASLRDAESAPSFPICVASVKGARISVTDDRLEDAKYLRGMFSRCSFFQRLLDQQPAPILYTLSIDLQGNRYNCEFQTQKNNTRKCRDQRLYYKLLVYVKMVLRTVETVRRRRVEQLGLEFYVGDEGTVWLLGCTHLRLETHKAAGSEATEGKKADETPKTDSEAGAHLKSWLTVDKRLKQSVRKFPPIRIATPHQFQPETTVNQPAAPVCEPEPDPPADHQQLRLSNQSSLSPSFLYQPGLLGTQRKPSNFYNPHFKEIIARKYAKSRNWLSTDIEEAFIDMEMKVLQDEEASPGIKRGESLLKRSASGQLFMSPSPELVSSQRRAEDSHKEIHTEATFERKATLRLLAELSTANTRKAKQKPRPIKPVSSLDKILALYHTQPAKAGRSLHRKMCSLPVLPTPKNLCFALRRE